MASDRWAANLELVPVTSRLTSNSARGVRNALTKALAEKAKCEQQQTTVYQHD